MKEKLKNENGYILVTTLIVMAILAVLGTTLLNFSSIEALQSKHYEKTLQSKYLARSGADIMAEYIISNKDDFENLYDNEKPTLRYEMNLEDEKTFIKVEEILDDQNERQGFNIISKGQYDNSKKTIELKLKKIKLGNEVLFHKPLEIVDSGKTRYNKIDDSVIENIIKENNIKKENDIRIEAGRTENIDLRENKEYENIEIENNANLIIETGGKDCILLVNKLNSKGFINLSNNDGRVILIVKESAILENSYKDIRNHLVIIGKDSSEIDISPSSDTDTESNLHIYSPFGSTKLDSEVKINGGLIVSKDSEKEILKNNTIVHRLPDDINIKGYDFFNVKETYIKEKYDSSFK